MSVFIKPKDAAKLLGVTDRAVYKDVDNHNIPGEKEMVDNKIEVRIPGLPFLDCIKRRKEKLIKKVQHLQNSEDFLRRRINGN